MGRDAETGDFLPGFENGRTISTTDKVRLKSIVDRTRLIVVRKLGEEYVDEAGDAMAIEEDALQRRSLEQRQDTVHFEGFDNDDLEDEEYEEALEKRIAKVYEKSIGELGNSMGGAPVGMISDD